MTRAPRRTSDPGSLAKLLAVQSSSLKRPPSTPLPAAASCSDPTSGTRSTRYDGGSAERWCARKAGESRQCPRRMRSSHSMPFTWRQAMWLTRDAAFSEDTALLGDGEPCKSFVRPSALNGLELRLVRSLSAGGFLRQKCLDVLLEPPASTAPPTRSLTWQCQVPDEMFAGPGAASAPDGAAGVDRRVAALSARGFEIDHCPSDGGGSRIVLRRARDASSRQGVHGDEGVEVADLCEAVQVKSRRTGACWCRWLPCVKMDFPLLFILTGCRPQSQVAVFLTEEEGRRHSNEGGERQEGERRRPPPAQPCASTDGGRSATESTSCCRDGMNMWEHWRGEQLDRLRDLLPRWREAYALFSTT